MDTETISFAKNPTKFIHLRHLALYCFMYREPKSALVVLRLTQILEAAPQLEHFVLHMRSFDWESYSYMKKRDFIHSHMHNHLKTVHITGMLGLSGQLELAKYILQSAHALELMTLNLEKRKADDQPWKPNNYSYLLKLEKFAKNWYTVIF
ncbi:unnamed protein product [Urochloa humidicola]